jgi:hypothetical protein
LIGEFSLEQATAEFVIHCHGELNHQMGEEQNLLPDLTAFQLSNAESIWVDH